MKKKGIGSEAKAERMANADADLQLFNESEKTRQLQKQKKRRVQGREDEVFYDFDLYYVSSFYLFSVFHLLVRVLNIHLSILVINMVNGDSRLEC